MIQYVFLFFILSLAQENNYIHVSDSNGLTVAVLLLPTSLSERT